MTFSESVSTCMSKYTQGKGRASRSEFWYFALFTWLVSMALIFFIAISQHSLTSVVVSDLVNLAFVLPSITVTVRRLHDTNRSAWNYAWVLLPILGWIAMFFFLVQPGNLEPNNYGAENAA